MSKTKWAGLLDPQGTLNHSKVTDTLGKILKFQVLLKASLQCHLLIYLHSQRLGSVTHTYSKTCLISFICVLHPFHLRDQEQKVSKPQTKRKSAELHNVSFPFMLTTKFMPITLKGQLPTPAQIQKLQKCSQIRPSLVRI